MVMSLILDPDTIFKKAGSSISSPWQNYMTFVTNYFGEILLISYKIHTFNPYKNNVRHHYQADVTHTSLMSITLGKKYNLYYIYEHKKSYCGIKNI